MGYQADNAKKAALVTNYLKANKHRIKTTDDHQAIRLEAHKLYGLALSKKNNG